MWLGFAKFIERESGHITVSLVLILISYLLWLAKMPKAEDILMFALGVLSRSMVGHKDNVTNGK